MNKNFLFSLMGLFIFTNLFLTSCSDDDDKVTGEVGVKSVAITNGGENGDERVEAVLSGDVFTAQVSPLSNMKALRLEINANEGTTTTPASGSTVDFEENEGTQALVAVNGSSTKTYTIKVTQNTLGDELAIMNVKVSGVYGADVQISHADKNIHLTFTNVLGTTAILSDFELNPASATIKSSKPALISDGDTDYMEIDFSTNSEKSITVANGSEEKTYTITATISEAGLNPTTATVVFDQILGSGLNPLLGTNDTRGAYFDGRYVYFASRASGNNIYYYDIKDASKEMKSLNMGTDVISGGTFAVSDIRVTDNGGIYVCSMAMSKEGKFNVYYWKDLNAEPVKILDYAIEDPVNAASTVRLGDALSIVGDPQTTGFIATSNFPNGNETQGQFYIWNYSNGNLSSNTPTVVDLLGKYDGASAADPSLGQYARISSIPGDNNNYLVTGASSGLLIVDNQFNVTYELNRELPIQGRAMDPHFFEYNGLRYLTYTINREWEQNGGYLEVVALVEGDSFVEGLKAISEKSIDEVSVYKQAITNNASGGAVWVASSNSVKVVDDKVYVFGFVCEYGGLVVEFNK